MTQDEARTLAQTVWGANGFAMRLGSQCAVGYFDGESDNDAYEQVLSIHEGGGSRPAAAAVTAAPAPILEMRLPRSAGSAARRIQAQLTAAFRADGVSVVREKRLDQ